ncbi:hypothetical protein CHS0354_014732 [Potamilus streckersoni]|uniref:MARVEL domain-containing protein n=1 Tax=Potamilus streckersoni TaxID=2493646 RepID=A0AAE0SPZ9_9BIVA|nr:hypothetical protein CHS0354_014732 [Potamilus streckersoni]
MENKQLARVTTIIFAILWTVFAVTQIGVGFSTNGNCEMNQRLPIYLGIHGLINLTWSVFVPLFVFLSHKNFYVRVIFYVFWGVEGVLVIYGLAEFYGTNEKLISCSENCKSCASEARNGSMVTETFILIMYFIASILILSYECTNKCKYCKTSGNTVYPERSQPASHMSHSYTTAINGTAAQNSRITPSAPPIPLTPPPSQPPSYDEVMRNY